MKKFTNLFIIFLVLCLGLFLVSCGDNLADNPDTPIDPSEQEEFKADLIVNTTSVELFVGETFKVEYEVKNMDGFTLDYSSSDSSVASIDKGVITGNGVGEATITIKLNGTDISKDIKVKVNGVTKLTLSDKSLSLFLGDTYKLQLEKEYADSITWESSNSSVATVADGLVSAVGVGKAVITVKSGSVEASCEVEVTEDVKILVNGASELYVGRSTKLTATLKGFSGAFTWESEDSSIAEVDNNGNVTGLKAGVVAIICSTEGYSTSFEIVVTAAPTIEISGKQKAYIGRSIQLTAKVTNTDAEVTWESRDSSIATVNANGLVTGVAPGTVFINAKVEDISVSYKITVEEEPQEVFLDYAGGVSPELYKASTPIASFTINHYGGTKNDGYAHFWANGYESNIYLTNRDGDPTATFSDRIYIAKNPYSGYYEIINILTSGGSSWPTAANGFAYDAEYVITISNSYSGYRSIHEKVLKLEVGQIVMIAASDWTGISNSTPSNVKFFGKEIDATTLTIKRSEFTALPTPTRVGFDFVGWFDEFGNKVENLTEVDKYYELTAHWDELNPVTDITVSKLKQTMTKGDSVQLEASVVPSNAYFKEVYFASSNPDVIKVSGSGYVTAVNSGVATLTVTDYMGRVTKEFEITVYAESSVDIEFPNDYNGFLKAGETLQLVGKYYGRGESSYAISYSSSNESVATIDSNGLLTAIKDGEVVITVTATSSSKSYEAKATVTVGAKTVSDKVDEVLALIQEYNFGRAQTINFCIYNDGDKRYYQANYGSVNYYLFDAFNVNTEYTATAAANSSGHRSRRTTDQIEFVTVHDTATLTGTVVNIASYMATGSTSIHYTVGNYATYAVVPETYIAYHAGDGTGTAFYWTNTGVKAPDDSTPPKITVVKNSSGKWVFAINGELTNIAPSISNGSKTIADPSKGLTSLGPVWKIQNGEYYFGNTHADFSQTASGVIGSYGGNNNSIGIEMCVNTTNDMFDTLQRTAKLVADICIRNNLDLTRVKQHNTWTGKNCPQVILAGDYWDQFMMMVEIEYILMKDYKDAKIEFKSNNPDIVTNTGRIIHAPAITTTVSYDVTVTIGGSSKTITLYTVVPGTTTWEQWNGLYPSSRNWNDGKYIK